MNVHNFGLNYCKQKQRFLVPQRNKSEYVVLVKCRILVASPFPVVAAAHSTS